MEYYISYSYVSQEDELGKNLATTRLSSLLF
jgi:hypothetical protein